MPETMNSQVQQNQQALRGAFTDPIVRLTAMYEEIGRLEEAGLSLAAAAIDGSSEWLKQSARMATHADQAVRLDSNGGTRVTEAFDEYARLLKDSLRYGSQMAAAWRKLAVEAATRTAEAITPKA